MDCSPLVVVEVAKDDDPETEERQEQQRMQVNQQRDANDSNQTGGVELEAQNAGDNEHEGQLDHWWFSL